MGGEPHRWDRNAGASIRWILHARAWSTIRSRSRPLQAVGRRSPQLVMRGFDDWNRTCPEPIGCGPRSVNSIGSPEGRAVDPHEGGGREHIAGSRLPAFGRLTSLVRVEYRQPFVAESIRTATLDGIWVEQRGSESWASQPSARVGRSAPDAATTSKEKSPPGARPVLWRSSASNVVSGPA